MRVRVPRRLGPGSTVRVIAPALSMAVYAAENQEIRDRHFAELGLSVTLGKHVTETDPAGSSSIRARVEDFMEAFTDPSVDAILTAIGGFNSNELLPFIDWPQIASNPKIFCGYSDITALHNAILAQCGFMTYIGPHHFNFGMDQGFGPTQQHFVQCLWSTSPFSLRPPPVWSDDRWYQDQQARSFEVNEGWWPMQTGRNSGVLVGGNLSTFSLLHGTCYIPSLRGSIVLVEDDQDTSPADFDRRLTSLLQQPDAEYITGLLIGRFQRRSGMTYARLQRIIETKDALHGRPVVANVDASHTDPLYTLPIGGILTVEADAERRTAAITVEVH
jgi:muramoyltetrapeptide carboxypeptidase